MCPPALYCCVRLCLAILYVRLPALGCCGRLCLAILCLPALDVASSSFDFEKHKLFGVYGGVITEHFSLFLCLEKPSDPQLKNPSDRAKRWIRKMSEWNLKLGDHARALSDAEDALEIYQMLQSPLEVKASITESTCNHSCMRWQHQEKKTIEKHTTSPKRTKPFRSRPNPSAVDPGLKHRAWTGPPVQRNGTGRTSRPCAASSTRTWRGRTCGRHVWWRPKPCDTSASGTTNLHRWGKVGGEGEGWGEISGKMVKSEKSDFMYERDVKNCVEVNRCLGFRASCL